MKISRALISVSDKTGVASFARALERQGVDIISTGGTADLLRKENVPVAEAIEKIDIGGPSLIRSAAKNYESVTVVVDPADYDLVLENLRDNNGETTLKLRERLAIKAFIKSSDYDRAIGNFLNKEQTTDASFSLSLPLAVRLRYGENPHQTAALYGDFDRHFEKLHGKELSFNNILDIS